MSPGCVVLKGRREIVDGLDVDAVDGDDRVAFVELLGAGDVLGTALPVDVEAQQLLDLHRPRDQLGVVTRQCEGHELGDLTRGPHHLQVDRAPLGRRLRTELLLVGEEADLGSIIGDPPAEHGLRRFGNRDEEHSPIEFGVHNDVGTEVGVGHPVGDCLHRRRDDGIRGGLADHPAVAFDLLAGDEARRKQRRDDDRRQREQSDSGHWDSPPTAAPIGPAHPPDRLGRRRERQWRH